MEGCRVFIAAQILALELIHLRVVKGLVGADLPLTEALPLASDLWALGMLLSYLFLGTTIFRSEQYVTIASDGQVMPTDEVCAPPLGQWVQSMAHRTQQQTGQSIKHLDSTSFVKKILDSVKAKSLFAISFVLDKAFPPAVEQANERIMTIHEATTLALASGHKSLHRKSSCNPLDKLVKEAFERVEVVTTVADIVGVQVDLLRSAGASKGVSVIRPSRRKSAQTVCTLFRT